MNFLPPAFVRCETCGGCRFNRETLDIEYAGKNIAQVLELTVEEALEFFSAHPKIRRPLEALARHRPRLSSNSARPVPRSAAAKRNA